MSRPWCPELYSVQELTWPGEYKPPENCPFNRVVLNLTVVSEGRQFDRLAIMYLGDTELWRTSTAEPTQHPGISWTVWKDTTPFLSLWHEPQTIIFDLGNVVNDIYTGLFNATLTATFFDASLVDPAQSPADIIVPVSARHGQDGTASSFVFPEVQAVNNITLPRNIRRAVFSVAATGQAGEEFWWSNVPQRSAYVFNSTAGPVPALSSFREVRVRIDGRIAGLSWPFPVVFTGGVSPPLHRPIVGIEAFDLREQEIDVTPWLGLLCDGKEHTFSMEVVGVDDTKEPTFSVVPMYWVLTGKIFLWLDDEGSITTGSTPETSVSDNDYQAIQNSSPNEYVDYKQTVDRAFVAKSKIRTQKGDSVVTWAQSFSMANDGYLQDHGQSQEVTARYGSTHKAMANDWTYFVTKYNFPISTNYKYKSPDGDYDFSLSANLSQGQQHVVTGLTVFISGIEPFLPQLSGWSSGAVVDTIRNGSAFFYQSNEGQSGGGFGNTHQGYRLGAKALLGAHDPDFGVDKLLYMRDVVEVNETITKDTRYVFSAESPLLVHLEGMPPRPESNGGGFAPLRVNKDGISGVLRGESTATESVQVDDKAARVQENVVLQHVGTNERGHGDLDRRNRLLGDW